MVKDAVFVADIIGQRKVPVFALRTFQELRADRKRSHLRSFDLRALLATLRFYSVNHWL